MSRASRLVSVDERGVVIGQDHHRAKLTDDDVWLIHALHDEGLGYLRIARKFECSKSIVAKIIKGHKRGHVAVGQKRIAHKPRYRFRAAHPDEFDMVYLGQP